MMLKPSLQVKRLHVLKGGKRVYDESFHPGINIIRGDNSSGKSSIMDLLFFGLGGDFSSWKPEPGSCDTVYVEAQLNGETVVLRREITIKKHQPMWVYYGYLDEAKADADGWMRYGFSRSDDRQSFSQIIFGLLGLPDVSSADESNLTIHQILRLLYADQLTPVSRIFRLERFDTPQRREAISDLLLGVYDTRVYSTQIALREAEADFDKISTDLKNIYRILKRTGTEFSVTSVEKREAQILSDMNEIEDSITKVRREIGGQIEAEQSLPSGLVEKLRNDIAAITDKITLLKSEASRLEFSIEDSKALVLELKTNLRQLEDGYAGARAFGSTAFSFCPACYTPTEPSGAEICHLCKAPIDVEPSERLGQIRAQISQQIKESTRLIKLKSDEIGNRRSLTEKLEVLLLGMQQEYRSLRSDYESEAKVTLESAIAERGYKRRELEDIAQQKQQLAVISELQEKKSRLNETISDLKQILQDLESAAQSRRSRILNAVTDKISYILQNDIKSEKEFVKSPNVELNFWDDNILVNERSSFSASSLTILRNAVHAAMLWASTDHEQMCYPRFLMMDNIEDKGMTQERSRNFQRLLVDIGSSLNSDYQLIFTTSMIDSDLNDSDLVVGRYYTFEHKSLDI